MVTKPEILDSALDVLRGGGTLTLDSVAGKVGLTKPGVVHHFATKEILALAVLDHVIDHWEREMRARAGEGAGPADRLRAYAEYALLGKMDAADLALLSDPKLRGKLAARWAERTNKWFGDLHDPRLITARLVADGAWIDRCLGLLDLNESDRAATSTLVAQLIARENDL